MPGTEHAISHQSTGHHRRTEVRAFGRQGVVFASGVANDKNLGAVDVRFNFFHLAGKHIADGHHVNRYEASGC